MYCQKLMKTTMQKIKTNMKKKRQNKTNIMNRIIFLGA